MLTGEHGGAGNIYKAFRAAKVVSKTELVPMPTPSHVLHRQVCPLDGVQGPVITGLGFTWATMYL